MAQKKSGWDTWLEFTKEHPVKGLRALAQATGEALGEELVAKPFQSIAKRASNAGESMSLGLRQFRETLDAKKEEISEAWGRANHTNPFSDHFADPISKDPVWNKD